MFFFFKQKTAYEMRISDWSSDVCSSDLHRHAEGNDSRRVGERDFLVESMRLCGGPPWAAVFGRPMARQPTALMKNGMPLFMILFGQSFAGAHLVSDSSRQLGLQQGSHPGTDLTPLHRDIGGHRARARRVGRAW